MMPTVESVPELGGTNQRVYVYRTSRLNRVLNVVPAAAIFIVSIGFSFRATSWSVGTPILVFGCVASLVFFGVRYNVAFRYRVVFAPDRIEVQFGRRWSEVLRADVVGVRRLVASTMDGYCLKLETKDGTGVDILPILGQASELMHWINGLEDLSTRDSIWNQRM